MTNPRITDPLLAHLVSLEHAKLPSLRCVDCWGYTVHAAEFGVVGRYCGCPFDSEHA